MTLDEIITVLHAARQGKAIEYRRRGEDKWKVIALQAISWNFTDCEYRIKREPREWWLCYVNTGCVCGSPIEDKCGWHAYDDPSDRYPCIHVREVLDEGSAQ